MSSSVTRPPGPVPATALMSTPLSWASLRTLGVARTFPPEGAVAVAVAVAVAGAAAGADVAAGVAALASPATAGAARNVYGTGSPGATTATRTWPTLTVP